MRVLSLLLALCVVCASCTSNTESGQVSVFAASSLTDVMSELGSEYERVNPGVEIVLNFAGSTTLRTQLFEGAPADVVMLANVATMNQLSDEQLISEPSVSAGNRMVLAVPRSDSLKVQTLTDLADDSLLIGLCAADVPCGATAREILANAGVTPSLDTNEPDVRSLLAKIASGELDAGIVYATDVCELCLGASGVDAPDQPVRGIDIDPALSSPNLYPIAAVNEASNGIGADGFIAFVLSEAGQTILASYGFLTAAEAQAQ